MSKYDLQSKASELSSVAYEESQRVLNLHPSLYDRLGVEGIQHLSRLFYDSVFSDWDNQWFMNIFASSTKEEAIDNQFRFLVQTFGGPSLYRDKKGKYTRLVGRHANFIMGHAAAKRWMHHMEAAINKHEGLEQDDEARDALKSYFRFMAHYIVVAKEFMRPDQLTGGNQMDKLSNW